MAINFSKIAEMKQEGIREESAIINEVISELTKVKYKIHNSNESPDEYNSVQEVLQVLGGKTDMLQKNL